MYKKNIVNNDKKLKLKLKIGDFVRVMVGKNKGQEGKVLSVDRIKNRVVVENINLVTKHQKPNAQNQQGTLVKQEASVHASNVMFISDGIPTRLGIKINDDGKRIRFSKKNNKLI
ncbi:MAG: 50S ribosomal protein L24 [Clostridiales bacterium]|nr:50S ribosomal protein L24 [Clostridiales bacterium]